MLHYSLIEHTLIIYSSFFSSFYCCFSCLSRHSYTQASLMVHTPCYYRFRGLAEPLVHHASSPEDKSNQKLVCDVNGCGKEFANIYLLRKHIGFHFDDYNFQCNHCGHQSKVKSDMVKHIKRHSRKYCLIFNFQLIGQFWANCECQLEFSFLCGD